MDYDGLPSNLKRYVAAVASFERIGLLVAQLLLARAPPLRRLGWGAGKYWPVWAYSARKGDFDATRSPQRAKVCGGGGGGGATPAPRPAVRAT